MIEQKISTKKLWQAKLMAFGVHILFSATIIGIFMAFVTQVWFPGMLFKLEDVWEGLRILVPVDAILGPLLTLVLFVPGKKGLVGDLAIIALLQISALVYGAYTIYDQRPEVIVFAGDRFEVLPSSIFEKDKLNSEYFEKETLPYPMVTYALPAQNKEEMTDFVLNNVQYQRMAERFRPINNYREVVSAKSLNIDYFEGDDQESSKLIEKLKADFNSETQGLYILQGTTTQGIVVILDNEDFRIQGYSEIDPWRYYKPGKK